MRKNALQKIRYYLFWVIKITMPILILWWVISIIWSLSQGENPFEFGWWVEWHSKLSCG